MEMDLDLIDLDFGDRVKDFLEHKLREVKSNNDSTEQKLKERNQQFIQTLEAEKLSEKETCIVTWEWKKYCNKKYVICYTLINSSDKALEGVKPLLTWSSSKQFKYNVTIYTKNEVNEITECINSSYCPKLSKNFIKSNSITSEAYIIITTDVPSFLENLEYIITGKFLTNCGNKEMLLDVPNVQISSEDITNREVCYVPMLTNDNIGNVLAAFSSSETADLVLVFPEEWNIALDSTFEIHCSLTKMDLSCSCKKYFVANRLSDAFDNSILEVHTSESNMPRVKCAVVYFSSKSALFSLLHHIHQHIPGLLVIPRLLLEHYKMKYCTEIGNTLEVLQEFQDSISKELELIDSFSQNFAKRDTREFRLQLTDLEKGTDLLYLKICGMNNCNDRL